MMSPEKVTLLRLLVVNAINIPDSLVAQLGVAKSKTFFSSYFGILIYSGA